MGQNRGVSCRPRALTRRFRAFLNPLLDVEDAKDKPLHFTTFPYLAYGRH